MSKTVLYPLPDKVKGFVVADPDNGDCIIVLNSKLTREANQKTYLHEISHKINNDLYTDCSVEQVENMRHKGSC